MLGVFIFSSFIISDRYRSLICSVLLLLVLFPSPFAQFKVPALERMLHNSSESTGSWKPLFFFFFPFLTNKVNIYFSVYILKALFFFSSWLSSRHLLCSVLADKRTKSLCCHTERVERASETTVRECRCCSTCLLDYLSSADARYLHRLACFYFPFSPKRKRFKSYTLFLRRLFLFSFSPYSVFQKPCGVLSRVYRIVYTLRRKRKEV